jgi:sulfur carrier protein
MVQVNGQAYEVAGRTVESLLLELEYDFRTIAVELNEEIIPKTTLDQVTLKDGDVLEVVRFVGGG